MTRNDVGRVLLPGRALQDRFTQIPYQREQPDTTRNRNREPRVDPGNIHVERREDAREDPGEDSSDRTFQGFPGADPRGGFFFSPTSCL